MFENFDFRKTDLRVHEKTIMKKTHALNSILQIIDKQKREK